jgi:tRNA(fMet)-specific endonuclease VapC
LERLIVADTDVIIDYFSGMAPSCDVIESLIKDQALAVSSITSFELFAGVIGKKRLAAIELLISQTIVIPFDTAASKQSGKLYTYLKEKGKLIGNQDILIAGTCLSTKLPIFTRNLSHFKHVPGLELYQAGQ